MLHWHRISNYSFDLNMYFVISFTSGGNKRKLSIALALIGAPPLILLDEPTAGVDPVSRRKIWKILSLARIHSGASVILTTHRLIKNSYNCMKCLVLILLSYYIL